MVSCTSSHNLHITRETVTSSTVLKSSPPPGRPISRGRKQDGCQRGSRGGALGEGQRDTSSNQAPDACIIIIIIIISPMGCGALCSARLSRSKEGQDWVVFVVDGERPEPIPFAEDVSLRNTLKKTAPHKHTLQTGDWRLGTTDHWSGAAGAPEQWKWTLSHFPSRRCQTRVSSDWLERGRPVESTNCVRRM